MIPQTATSPASLGPHTARVAGRYVFEAELGVGGMGSVSRVRDESTGKTLALKQLLPAAGRTGAALFQREYHTLVLLKHPRIIEVYEYGIDAGDPYYTMELLDGADLRALAPLGYREACRHLRDVASSLALLAAHRLVHRDLTARNVRVTSDGRSKLIDFGALAPFGLTDAVVGTAPYVPPEALRGLPLDQRADLFALGALSYFLLTRTHAFQAQSLGELEAAWKKRPERPSERVMRLIEDGAALTPVPQALDDLVLSLLSLDPMARPQHAAEVIERLASVARLEPEPGPLAAESYLLSAELVGRTAAMQHAKALLSSAVQGSGGVLSIHHAPGQGGTRLLTEIGLEARLLGATVLRVDGDVHRGPHAIARVLAEKLTTALPMEAKAAAPADIASLGWVRAYATERPSFRHSLLDVASAPLAVRLRIQLALESWFLAVAQSCPLAILVDNAHKVDEGSAAFLAVISGVAKENAIALFAAFRDGDPILAPAPMSRLENSGQSIELGPLSAADTRAFVQSLFGNVPNCDRLTFWVHGLSSGNPLHLLELAHYLVANRIAHYADGTWVLPRELPADLPSRVEEAQELRLSGLKPETLDLASALAVHQGHLSLELCVALAQGGPTEAFAALDELVSSGILIGHDEGYRFAQKATREQQLGRLTPDDQKRFHRVVGEHLAQVEDPDFTTTLDAGWHLFLGGEVEEGAKILRRVGLDLVRADELPEAISALEAAVSVYRKLDRPRSELCGLLHPLAFGGFYVNRRLADRYADEALHVLAQEIGLDLTKRLRPYLGTYLSLLVGLVYAVVLHFFGGRGGVRGLSNQISIMGGLSNALTGASIICLDSAEAARRASVFEPFEPLGLWHAGAFCHAMAKTLVQLTEDRAAETIDELRQLLSRLDTGSVVGFPERMKPLTRGGLLYALGALEGFMDAPIALERANELEACGLRLYDMVACQIRANYHACRGENALAREYEERVEVHATRNGSTWQAEVWVPSSRLASSRRTFDLIGVKRAGEELDRLSREIPSLARYAKLARATLAHLRGEHRTAISLYEELWSETSPRGFIGWTALAAGLAETYSETGQHERAETLCTGVVGMLSDADRSVVALHLDVEIQLALAEAGLGRTAEAARRLDDLIAKHAVNRGPVTLGSLHRARVKVALRASDTGALRHHRKEMETWFRSTKNPALIAECERMASWLKASSAPPERRQDMEPATVQERVLSSKL